VVEAVELGMPSNLSARLNESKTWEQRFRLVGDELWQRLQSSPSLSPFVRKALTLIDSHHGAVRVHQLSQTLGASRKHVHARFLAETGFSPKRYASLRRFTRVKNLLALDNYGSLATLSSRVGYVDQAHLTREVRQFAGMTPRQLAFEMQKPIAFEAQQLKREGDGLFPGPG
jgi:AraC-like DNA-binding protein